MSQQINLLTPILLAPRRHFSALAMLQATGVLLVAAAALSGWLQLTDRRAERQHQQLLAQFAAERHALQVARAGLPPAGDPAALEQQWRALTAGNTERADLLQAVSGVAAPGLRHSDLLQWVARTLPDSVWLTELRWAGGRLELVGGTLDTAALRPWLTRLSTHPLLAGQSLQALRVEQLGAGASEPTHPPLLASADLESLARSRQAVWSFRAISAAAGSAAGSTPASGAAP